MKAFWGLLLIPGGLTVPYLVLGFNKWLDMLEAFFIYHGMQKHCEWNAVNCTDADHAVLLSVFGTVICGIAVCSWVIIHWHDVKKLVRALVSWRLEEQDD